MQITQEQSMATRCYCLPLCFIITKFNNTTNIKFYNHDHCKKIIAEHPGKTTVFPSGKILMLLSMT
jgi:hypothetical protein